MGYMETNVRILPCVLDALQVIVARRGTSRDGTLRQLLGEHVERQESLDPDERLTHVSTVLRYPRPPFGRRAPRPDRPLRLRLPSDLVPRARAVSLHLPGQSPRAHRDYQSRSLTDAVVTAIAFEERFSDEFLDGLRPMLRHGSARGLWHLAAAATSTAPEVAVLAEAEALRAEGPGSPPRNPRELRLLLIAEELEEQVAWHAPMRFQVAANLARDLLTGPPADQNEQMLYQQGQEWERHLVDLRDGGKARDRARAGVPEKGGLGRGATAVWRAERRVETQDFTDWLIEPHHQLERKIRPPGWPVRLPAHWHGRSVAAQTAPVPDPYADWLTEGRVLAFPYQEQHVVWPLVPAPGIAGCAPVPEFEPVVRAASTIRADRIVAFIEAILIDWHGEDDPAETGDDLSWPSEIGGEHSEVDMRLRLPIDKAHEYGFIDLEEKRRAMDDARAATLRSMTEIIDSIPSSEPEVRRALQEAYGDSRQFGRIAQKARTYWGVRIRFTVTRAWWHWPGGSVAGAAAAGRRPDLVECLAGWAFRQSSLILEFVMQRAWDDAFDRYKDGRV
ncbi:hypothetical protein [Actinomadura sp. K4S16]|uniref:hypothetical protein n=1 Tax=Actinomadura sp. K4S16 TaxID=1316147 RepID=UPI0011EE0BA7|nr:hypothetical protein [Actinomadura sp. K4S16]